MSSKKKAVTKSETFNKGKNESTLKTASGITIETAAKKVTEAQLSIGKTLSDVTNQLQNQLQELETVSQAVEIKKAELETVYGKEQILKSTDELTVEFEQHKQSIEDQKDSIARARAQEEADFNFNLDQSRRNAEAAYNETRRVVSNTHRDEDEARNKAFFAREESLRAQEKEVADLRNKVTGFPAELDAAVKKAEAVKEAVIKREYEHKLQLLQKDYETSTTINHNTVTGLNARLANQDKVIADLQVQLSEAYKKIENISNKAVESAAATKSLADLQAMVQTQSSNGQQRKA